VRDGTTEADVSPAEATTDISDRWAHRPGRHLGCGQLPLADQYIWCGSLGGHEHEAALFRPTVRPLGGPATGSKFIHHRRGSQQTRLTDPDEGTASRDLIANPHCFPSYCAHVAPRRPARVRPPAGVRVPGVPGAAGKPLQGLIADGRMELSNADQLAFSVTI
jgi:hypothetical protein